MVKVIKKKEIQTVINNIELQPTRNVKEKDAMAVVIFIMMIISAISSYFWLGESTSDDWTENFAQYGRIFTVHLLIFQCFIFPYNYYRYGHILKYKD